MDGEQNPQPGQQFSPGQTVTPGAQAPAPVSSPEPSEAPAQLQVQVPQGLTPIEPEEGVITWRAGEYLHHQKTGKWFGVLMLGAVVLAALVYLLTRDIMATIVIFVAAGAFAYYGKREPRELDYQLDPDGLTIGGKFYPYDLFRSFAVMRENDQPMIALLPLKRFAPLTTIYYEPAIEDAVVDALADQLPMEERQPDAIDRLMSKIKF